jgi:hypothetical protein
MKEVCNQVFLSQLTAAQGFQRANCGRTVYYAKMLPQILQHETRRASVRHESKP